MSMNIVGPRAAAVDLYWLPLGAGASVVHWNGRIYERFNALLARRHPLELYHAALIVTASSGRHVIELAPVVDGDGATRGVVGEGPVGLAMLGRFRLFRYELRCWPNGELPDVEHAVASPQRLTQEPARVRRLLAQLQRVPWATWGRDEQRAGEMWNSNSVISWLLTRAGVPLPVLPAGGRAPGWDAGIAVAGRDDPARCRCGGVRSRHPPQRRPPSLSAVSSLGLLGARALRH